MFWDLIIFFDLVIFLNLRFGQKIKEIKYISGTRFKGIINVGKKKQSDFLNYKKFKSNIKPCKRKDILKDLSFKIAKDASMNLNLFKKLKSRLWKRFH